MIPFILCTKYTCPHANKCYRLRASPENLEEQRYNEFISICNENDDYHFFISVRENDKVLELDEILKNNEKLSENESL